MEEYYEFLRKAKKNDVDGWLKTVDENYYRGSPSLTDENYDNLIKIYESRFGKRESVGSSPTHSEVNLPIAMMSLDKIMAEKELLSFMQKNPGPYVVMSKINGNSALYFKNKLYNRGDGTIGTDLSHMLPYVNLPPSDNYVKGELVITKRDYVPYEEQYKTNLSMINGLLNSRSADPEKLKLFKFIAYDIISENSSSNMSTTLNKLKDMKFAVPKYVYTSTLSIEFLSSLFQKFKAEEEYDIDGLVITADCQIPYETRLLRENPKYMVAFKEYGETAVAIVESVVWEASKNSLVKPTVKINPSVTINNFTISSLTAFNAGYVRDNNVGPGTELIITHNTIPHILSVLTGTEASLPENPETWEWNETGVDILLKEENDEVKIAKIYEFFKQLEAKYCGEVTIGKLYHAGYDNIFKIVAMDKNEFLSRKIPGLGEGIFDRMKASIDKCLESPKLSQLMSASCVFGIGFGTKKLDLVVSQYPNVLDLDLTVDQIVSIKGFADKTAERFVEGLPKFREFLKELQSVRKVNFERKIEKKVVEKVVEEKTDKIIGLKIKKVEPQRKEPQTKDSEKIKNTENISGKTVVFTGFRDKNLENNIINAGGKVTTSVSKKTSFVVVGGKKGTGSAKETTAAELGIPIYSLDEFKKLYQIRTEFEFE
jgi:DNA ligase (NAD+)